MPLVRARGKAPNGGSGVSPSEADDTLCENVLFSHCFKNDILIFAFIHHKFSI